MSAYQIAIVGCGPVGLTLANCLVRSPFIHSIALIDRKLPSFQRKLPQLPNQRVYSINYPSLKLFENLGVLQGIRKAGTMNKIQVISKESEEYINWEQNSAKIIQNDELVCSLMQKLQQNGKGKVTFIESEIQKFENTENCRISLKNNEEIISNLIVGSDGNKSKVKELAKIATYGWSYRQRAIVCSMRVKSLDPTIGHQIYHEGNTLAILPLWDNYVSLVWSLGIPQFEHLMGLDEETFKEKLNNVIINSNNKYQSLRDFVPIDHIQKIQNKRLSFPLSTLQASNYTNHRIALIGDAAHSIHPMAGLGVNSGIGDSVLLANNIIKNMKTGNDYGQSIALSNFEATSKALNYSNSIAMETIKTAFEGNNTVMNNARKLGMKVLHNSSLMKQSMRSLVQENSPAFVGDFEWDS